MIFFVGVERIVDQVVNPKIATIFHPKVEEIVYKYLGIEKTTSTSPSTNTTPNNNVGASSTKNLNEYLQVEVNLLPTDLEAVSPDSEKKSVSDMSETVEEIKENEDFITESEDKVEDFESPPFERLEGLEKDVKEDKKDDKLDLEIMAEILKLRDNSNDSNNSKISGLTSQDSVESNKLADNMKIEPLEEIKVEIPLPPTPVAPPTPPTPPEEPLPPPEPQDNNNDSQLSQVSSNSRLSIITNSEETADVISTTATTPRLDITEEAQMPKFSENSNSVDNVALEKQNVQTNGEEEKEVKNFDLNKKEYEFTGTERPSFTAADLEEMETNNGKSETSLADDTSSQSNDIKIKIEEKMDISEINVVKTEDEAATETTEPKTDDSKNLITEITSIKSEACSTASPKGDIKMEVDLKIDNEKKIEVSRTEEKVNSDSSDNKDLIKTEDKSPIEVKPEELIAPMSTVSTSKEKEKTSERSRHNSSSSNSKYRDKDKKKSSSSSSSSRHHSTSSSSKDNDKSNSKKHSSSSSSSSSRNPKTSEKSGSSKTDDRRDNKHRSSYEKDRDRHKRSERDREKDKERDRDRDREKDRDKERDKEKDRDRTKDRDREKDRDKNKSHSHSSSKSKKDKDSSSNSPLPITPTGSDKKKDEKIIDDHSSSREKHNRKRRSTDRDSNEGGGTQPGTNSKQIKTDALVSSAMNTKDKSVSENSNSNSNNTNNNTSPATASLDSGSIKSPKSNIRVEEYPKMIIPTLPETSPDDFITLATPPIIVDQMLTSGGETLNIEQLITHKNNLTNALKHSDSHPASRTLEKIEEALELARTTKVKRPKFASNMAEARKLMKVRKKIERDEKKRMERAMAIFKNCINNNNEFPRASLNVTNDQGFELEFACDNADNKSGPIISSPYNSVHIPKLMIPKLFENDNENDDDMEKDLHYFPEKGSLYNTNVDFLKYADEYIKKNAALMPELSNKHSLGKKWNIKTFKFKIAQNEVEGEEDEPFESVSKTSIDKDIVILKSVHSDVPEQVNSKSKILEAALQRRNKVPLKNYRNDIEPGQQTSLIVKSEGKGRQRKPNNRYSAEDFHITHEEIDNVLQEKNIDTKPAVVNADINNQQMETTEVKDENETIKSKSIFLLFSIF